MTPGGLPIVGLTLGRDLPARPDYLSIRLAYTEAIASAGAIPVLVPPMSSPALDGVLPILHGIVFTGGFDVAPELYGEESHPTTRVDVALDETELSIARWVIRAGIPTLGICRGAQMLNVALGGTLIQDLPSQGLDHWQPGPRSETFHEIRLEAGSKLARIFKARLVEVNSFHHQAIGRVGPGLRAVARSFDGVIEAIEGVQHPWLLGVQFHPEDLVTSTASARLIAAFVEAAADLRKLRVPARTTSLDVRR